MAERMDVGNGAGAVSGIEAEGEGGGVERVLCQEEDTGG